MNVVIITCTGHQRAQTTRCHLLSHNAALLSVKVNAFTQENNCGCCEANKEYEVVSVCLCCSTTVIMKL